MLMSFRCSTEFVFIATRTCDTAIKSQGFNLNFLFQHHAICFHMFYLIKTTFFPGPTLLHSALIFPFYTYQCYNSIELYYSITVC